MKISNIFELPSIHDCWMLRLPFTKGKIKGFLFFVRGNVSGQSCAFDPALAVIADPMEIPGAVKFKDNTNINPTTIFDSYASEFGLKENDVMELIKTETDQLGYSHYEYQQKFHGLKVEGAIYSVHAFNNRAVSANGLIVKGLTLNTNPTRTEQQSLDSALNYIGASQYKWQIPAEENWLKQFKNDPAATFFPAGELVIARNLNPATDPNDFHLTYKFDIYAHSPSSRDIIYVDANNGGIVLVNPIIHDITVPVPTRYSGTQNVETDFNSGTSTYNLRDITRGSGIETFDLNTSGTINLVTGACDYLLSSAVNFSDNDNNWTVAEWNNPQKDNAAFDAHWGATMTYDYYLTKHGRNSFNNAGAKINSYVHACPNYANAYWNGLVMTYGDGNGSTINPLTAIDVCGHEITHAVTTNEANLIYSYQSGALNESFSDIFGSMIEYFASPSTFDWRVGEDVTTSGLGIRNMANPNEFGHPDTYLGTFWYTGTGDNGGVHINSGVQNFWFYLLSEGKTGSNDFGTPYSVAGIGKEKAAQIAYRNLTVYLGPTSNYAAARAGSIQAAKDLFGDCSFEVEQTAKAWNAVGVNGAPLVCVPVCTPPPSGMISWWTGDGNATDIAPSGNNNNGILMGGTTYVPGRVGQAYSFDGVDDYVRIPASASLPVGNDSRTVDLWVYTRESSWATDQNTIFHSGVPGGTQSFSLDMHIYPQMQFYGFGNDLHFVPNIPKEGWVHLAVTWDNTTSTMNIYSNGQLVATQINSTPFNTAFADFQIGLGAFGAYFDGLIDEFELFNRALSAAEIQAIYNAGSAGKCVPNTLTLRGHVFVDSDMNCTQSPVEAGVANRIVSATGTSGTYQGFTNSLGEYAIRVPAGTYTVSLVNAPPLTVETCTNVYNVTGTSGNLFAGDFFIESVCGAAAYVSAEYPLCAAFPVGCRRGACPGCNTIYSATFSNEGSDAMNAGANFAITLDPGVTYNFVDAVRTTCPVSLTPVISGSTLSWVSTAPLSAGTSCRISVNTSFNSCGTGLVTNASITASCPTAPTPVLTNAQPLNENCNCACDPNDKLVSPAGCGPLGNIARGEALTYRIRFQNIGGSPAQDVVIYDPLSSNLDLSTFKVINSSHEITGMEINPNNHLVIRYEGINLPDSISNPAGSTGFVIFQISPLASIPSGTTITNRAGIVFNQNPPVITNTTVNTIQDNPLPAVTLGSFAPICVNAAPINLTGGTPAGGTYSGVGVSNGQFNPSVAGVGTKTITYTYTSCSGCKNSDTATIIVKAAPTVTLCNFGPVCVNAAPFVLTGGLPAGGVYSGVGVSNGKFNPSVAGVGTKTIIYTFTNASGCKDSATSQIVVKPLPTVTLGSFTPICVNAAPINLTGGIPAGGIYSGVGVSNGKFNPSVAGVGMKTITYTYTGANGCKNSASSTIEVKPLPVVTLGTFAPVCVNASPITLTGGSPAGGTYSGVGVSAGVFNPSVAGVGTKTITYTFTNTDGCKNSATSTIIVQNCTPHISGPVDVCQLQPQTYSIPSVAGVTLYTWWVNGDASIAGNGNNQVTITFSAWYTTGNVNVGYQDPVTGWKTFQLNVTARNCTPAVSITGPSQVCKNQGGYMYSVPAVAGASFNWWVAGGDATISSGQGTNKATIFFGQSYSSGTVNVGYTNPASGVWTQLNMTVTASGCNTRTLSDDISKETEENAGLFVMVSPNPFEETISVVIDGADSENSKIILTDINGHVVYQLNNYISGEEIKLGSNLSSGVYLLKVISKNETRQFKIVKSK